MGAAACFCASTSGDTFPEVIGEAVRVASSGLSTTESIGILVVAGAPGSLGCADSTAIA